MTKYEELQEYLKNNQTTWLITGVAGFIGSNLLEKLLVLNQKVIGLDSFDTGYQKNIDEAILDANKILGEDVSKNFKFIKGDIKSIDDCKQACHNVDYVLHQAALGSVPRSIEDPMFIKACMHKIKHSENVVFWINKFGWLFNIFLIKKKNIG